MSKDTSNYTISNKGTLGRNALIVGAVFLVVSAIGWFIDPKQFYDSYLIAYTFWLTFALGGLFFTLVNHLFGSQWNIVMRRFTEAAMYSFPLLAIFFIPILFGMHDLYHWTHEEVVASDPILTAKAGYLNNTFFIIRAVFYFTVWFLISRVLYKLSLKQDKDPDDKIILKMKQISAPGMILFALTSTFASFDWLMSLEPHWFSTIYGLYFFAGNFLAILCFVILFGLNLRKKGYLVDTFTVEHYHDLAKIIFGFIIFWGYMGFSQYFLIWYANIPEETVYYLTRWENGWSNITLIIIFGHFVFPFLAVLIRASKRNFSWLKFVAIWLIIMHYVDMVWLIRPAISHGHGPSFSWMDLSTILAVGGFFLWNFWNNLTSNPLVPVGERRLEASIKFKV
ncbi:MAG: hypothetical protein D8M58_14560 [Calditrichaeota bacterium]|nr:MAG: hypothetical protein DWQ03_15800 [Calditrichota bacterium]MBL1206624.1 hypothetical protein [Calditrichota bacterium]NOG46451.1 hypothetical protein [Calditrichota bacterium]